MGTFQRHQIPGLDCLVNASDVKANQKSLENCEKNVEV